MIKTQHAAWIASLCLSPGLINDTAAQNYPTKPVHIITSPAGGGNDALARVLAAELPAPLGQPVIVDNRVAVISIEMVAKAPPDGYTLLLQGSNVWIVPLLRDNARYDAVADFSPITQLIREVGILVVHPSVPANSVKELIALAKARPGQLNYGSGLAGTSNHLGPELLKSMAGINIVRVPYKSGGAALVGLLANEVQLTIDGTTLVPHIKTGKLRALAVSSATAAALMPELPTISAAGVPGYESVALAGLFAPGKTPPPIVNRLAQESIKIFTRPDIKDKLFNSGVEVVASTPQAFAATIKADIVKWAKVVKDAGIKGD